MRLVSSGGSGGCGCWGGRTVNAVYGGIVVRETTKRGMCRTASGMNIRGENNRWDWLRERVEG